MSETLEQTKGKTTLVGRVKGIGNENAYAEGFTQSDKQYKRLQFFLETSDINSPRVEIFGMERDEVVAYSSKSKSTKRIPWKNRNDDHGDFKVLGTTCFLEPNPADSSKNLRKVLNEFDAIDYIRDNVKDGDVVRINGEIDFQEYENREGEKVSSTRFVIKSITKLKEQLDFNSPKFKEEANFEQEIVVSDLMEDDEANRLYVNAKIIKYGGDVIDTTFAVDTEKYPKLAANMKKRLSFGDKITVYGLIINATILKQEDEDIENPSVGDDDDWGGDSSIKDKFDNSYIREFIRELQIISVDSSSYEPKKYKEEDLISEDEDKFNGDIKESSGDDFSDEDDDDELPFD